LGDLTLEYWFLNIYRPLLAPGRRFPSPHFILFSKEEEEEGEEEGEKEDG